MPEDRKEISDKTFEIEATAWLCIFSQIHCHIQREMWQPKRLFCLKMHF